jgi:hypothetical protein
MGLQRNGKNQKRDEDDTMEKRRRRNEKDRRIYEESWFYDGIWRKEEDAFILVANTIPKNKSIPNQKYP